MVQPSRNFVTGDAVDVDEDRDNHGTIMAGILAEFAGMCVQLVNFKVSIKLSLSDLNSAKLNYVNLFLKPLKCIDKGPQVLNC